MGNGPSVPFKEDVHVVIVGGGYGGIALGMNLLKVCKVTLVDPKDSMMHNVGALRSCVEPKYANKVFIPYAPSFGDSFVRGKVVKINKEANFVTLEDGKEITYTYLVIATGFPAPFPGKVTMDYPDVGKDKGMELYQGINKQIVEAETVVCVGGGAVGVELAGEIKTDYPDKNVIVIHSSEVLCSKSMQAKAQKNLQALVKKKGITLMLNEKVSNLADIKFHECVKDQVLKTESGKEIQADLIFPCTGAKTGASLFKDDLGESIDERGLLKVDSYFLVEGTKNIYAIGDMCNIDEWKMAYLAHCHADELTKIFKANIAGTKPTPYKPATQFIMLLPVGRDGGVSEFKGYVLGDFATRMIKSRDLFTPRFWGIMKQKVPT